MPRVQGLEEDDENIVTIIKYRYNNKINIPKQ